MGAGSGCCGGRGRPDSAHWGQDSGAEGKLGFGSGLADPRTPAPRDEYCRKLWLPLPSDTLLRPEFGAAAEPAPEPVESAHEWLLTEGAVISTPIVLDRATEADPEDVAKPPNVILQDMAPMQTPDLSNTSNINLSDVLNDMFKTVEALQKNMLANEPAAFNSEDTPGKSVEDTPIGAERERITLDMSTRSSMQGADAPITNEQYTPAAMVWAGDRGLALERGVEDVYRFF